MVGRFCVQYIYNIYIYVNHVLCMRHVFVCSVVYCNVLLRTPIQETHSLIHVDDARQNMHRNTLSQICYILCKGKDTIYTYGAPQKVQKLKEKLQAAEKEAEKVRRTKQQIRQCGAEGNTVNNIKQLHQHAPPFTS